MESYFKSIQFSFQAKEKNSTNNNNNKKNDNAKYKIKKKRDCNHPYVTSMAPPPPGENVKVLSAISKEQTTRYVLSWSVIMTGCCWMTISFA